MLATITANQNYGRGRYNKGVRTNLVAGTQQTVSRATPGVKPGTLHWQGFVLRRVTLRTHTIKYSTDVKFVALTEIIPVTKGGRFAYTLICGYKIFL
jgi:hypothetical protein